MLYVYILSLSSLFLSLSLFQTRNKVATGLLAHEAALKAHREIFDSVFTRANNTCQSAPAGSAKGELVHKKRVNVIMTKVELDR